MNRIGATALIGLDLILLAGIALLGRTPSVGPSSSPTSETKVGPTPQPLPTQPRVEDYVERVKEPNGAIFRPRSDWAASFYRAASDPGPYREGASPTTRPLDDSDPEMQQLMKQVYAVGGCAQPGRPCQPAVDLVRGGGDRLAAYLITQYERTLEDGYSNWVTYLTLVGETQSDTGFEFISQRLERQPDLSIEERRALITALSHTAHEEAIDIALGILGSESDVGMLNRSVNVLWRVSIDVGHLRPDVRDLLLERRAEGWIQAKRAISYLNGHFGFLEEQGRPKLAP